VTYRWAFLYACVVFAFFWLSFCMSWVWKTVFDQERKLDKYRQDGQGSERKHSRNIASQALFYVVAFTMPYVWGMIIYIIDDEQTVFEYRSHDDAITWLHIVNAIIFPLQGLFNVLVYVRPRYLRLRTKEARKNSLFTNADSTTKGVSRSVISGQNISILQGSSSKQGRTTHVGGGGAILDITRTERTASQSKKSADLWSSQNHRQSATGASELLNTP